MSHCEGWIQIDPPLLGTSNMAIDEQMLCDANAIDVPVLRIYRWQEPTLSLGHFQSEESIPSDELWGRIPRVKRKTGGGAIVHDQELTYSLAIPTRLIEGSKGHSEGIYRSIHETLVEELRDLGIEAKLAESCTCKTGTGSPEFLCFLRRSPVDVVVQGEKVLGSAQRRTRDGLLQHGSLLLGSSMAAPQIRGLMDLAPSAATKINSESKNNSHFRNVEEGIDWDRCTSWFTRILTTACENLFHCYWLFRQQDYNARWT